MLKRLLVPALALAAVCALSLVPAQDSAAAGGLSVSMSCEPEPSGAICFASPFGGGNSYSWTTTGNLIFGNGGSANGPIRFVYCSGGGSGGLLTVTVTSPSGSSGSASRWVSCGLPLY